MTIFSYTLQISTDEYAKVLDAISAKLKYSPVVARRYNLLLRKRAFTPIKFNGDILCWSSENRVNPLTSKDIVAYFSQHSRGWIRLLDGNKIQVNENSKQSIHFSNAVVVTPHTFFDLEDWVRSSKPDSIKLGTKEHFFWVISFFKKHGFDGIIIDEFRNLPQSFYNRTFSNRRSTLGMLCWDSVIAFNNE